MSTAVGIEKADLSIERPRSGWIACRGAPSGTVMVVSALGITRTDPWPRDHDDPASFSADTAGAAKSGLQRVTARPVEFGLPNRGPCVGESPVFGYLTDRLGRKKLFGDVGSVPGVGFLDRPRGTS